MPLHKVDCYPGRPQHWRSKLWDEPTDELSTAEQVRRGEAARKADLLARFRDRFAARAAS